jgi:FkbM family methyltransferase
LARSLATILGALVQARHYRALARMIADCPDWPRVLRAYLTGAGPYPMDVAVRTPIGRQTARLYGPHDVLTLNEIFFRHDYPAEPSHRTVIDLGANIGLAALWFLSRHRDVRCYCYEPVPSNIERLRHTLAPFDGRYELHELAVADRRGPVTFGVEPTGRYGGIDRALERSFTVDCVHVNDVLEMALSRHDRVDVLKIDTEGAEHATLEAIAPELLARIGRIYVEDPRPVAALASDFRVVRTGTVIQYHARARDEPAAATMYGSASHGAR